MSDNADKEPQDINALPDNLDALFDFDNEVHAFPELRPSLNVEELTKQAEARYAAQRPIRPAAHVLDDDDADGGNKSSSVKPWKKGGNQKEDKRVIPKINDERLMGPNGFPALMEQSKKFKVKGKGHEAEDLARLMQMYQLWAHKMFPKTKFRDTVEKTEKICHDRRMTIQLSVWRDAAKELPSAAVDGEGEAEDGDGNPDADREEGGNLTTRPKDISSSTSSPGPSSPRTNRSSMGQSDFSSDDVRPDIFGLIDKSRGEITETDDDDSFWAGMELGIGDEVVTALKPPSTPPIQTDADMEEEDWDLVRQMEEEMEKEGGTAGQVDDPSTVVGAEPKESERNLAPLEGGIQSGLNNAVPAEDDWDDMYVDE